MVHTPNFNNLNAYLFEKTKDAKSGKDSYLNVTVLVFLCKT